MSAGPIETEIKLRLPDAASAHALLEKAGFTISTARVFEVNQVYDTPDSQIRNRGELLRLRLAGSRSVLTWKGQAVTGRHKSRPETEVEVSNFDSMDEIFRALGYAVTFRYEKYRTEFRQETRAGLATLDETPMGCFVELEGLADWIDDSAAVMGFSAADYITSSYGSLYLDYRQSQTEASTDMVFGTVQIAGKSPSTNG